VPESLQERERLLLDWLREAGVDTEPITRRLARTIILTKTNGGNYFNSGYSTSPARVINDHVRYADLRDIPFEEFYELRHRQRSPDYFPMVWSRVEYLLVTRINMAWLDVRGVRRRTTAGVVLDNLPHFPRFHADGSHNTVVVFGPDGFQLCDATLWGGIPTPYVTTAKLLELITHRNEGNAEITPARVRLELHEAIHDSAQVVHGFHTRDGQPWLTFRGPAAPTMHLKVRRQEGATAGRPNVQPVDFGHGLKLELCDRITIGPTRLNITSSIIRDGFQLPE
jgi:hypothetical protein